VFAGSNDAWKSPVGRFFHSLEEAEVALPIPPLRRSARTSKPHRNPIALAREWDALLADGTYSSRAELARSLGISRARVTQVLNLLNLVPPVLEGVSSINDPLPPRASQSMRCVGC